MRKLMVSGGAAALLYLLNLRRARAAAAGPNPPEPSGGSDGLFPGGFEWPWGGGKEPNSQLGRYVAIAKGDDEPACYDTWQTPAKLTDAWRCPEYFGG